MRIRGESEGKPKARNRCSSVCEASALRPIDSIGQSSASSLALGWWRVLAMVWWSQLICSKFGSFDAQLLGSSDSSIRASATTR